MLMLLALSHIVKKNLQINFIFENLSQVMHFLWTCFKHAIVLQVQCVVLEFQVSCLRGT